MEPNLSEVLAVAELSTGAGDQTPTQPDEGVFVFPASLEQIRYWTLDQLDSDSTASNMAIAARLEGLVDDAVVKASIHALVERHEALRTTFRLVDSQLCQVISEEARYNFAVTDLRNFPEPDRQQAAEAAVEEHSHARADLASGPALFARLIHLTDERHLLALTMHHIVCDGWSNGILIRDFTDFYKAFAQGFEPGLPQLPFQFADFTVWQQNWLESQAAQSALAYWRTHIRREMPAVDLPTDSPRRPQKSYPGHIESSLLPAELSERLRAYCRSHNATMHQVLLAAFEALVARYTNQNEFLLGSTIANRTQPGMENVVGRFANPQVILADVGGDPSYRELLGRVVAWSTESYAHQDLPFSRLMEEFQLDQGSATSQFLQVYFVYQKAFMQPQEAPGLKVIPRPSVSGGVNFDLLVSIVERAEGPRLQMEYNTILFRAERILRLMEMYVRVLTAVMDDDGLTVSHLPLLSQQDQNSISSSSTPSQVSQSTESLAQRIDNQASSLGECPAILRGGGQTSWKQLSALSRIYEDALRELSVSSGQTVFLRLESSADDAAAALALLRIGAVILPLPKSADATAWISLLAAHKPALALASADFAAQVSGVTTYERLTHSPSEQHEPSVAETQSAYPQAESIAWYGLVQSPDGDSQLIPSTHGLTLQHLRSVASAIDLRVGDAVLVTPSESATDAWIDILLPLVAGATLIYPENSPSSELPSLVEKHQVSFVFTTTPGVLQAIHDGWLGDRRLNVVLRGGVLTSAQIERLSSVPLRLWYLLSSATTSGPTALAKLTKDGQPRFTAMDSERLLVLDDNSQSVPADVSGELAVSGSFGTTRTGYLASISSSFDPDRLRDGGKSSNVEVLDFANRLVRMHGYRLRLSELEDVLWHDTTLAEVVGAVLEVEGTSTLVAYFRTFNGSTDTIAAVKQNFHSVAPSLVASAELIAVDSIPRRPDGSVDLSLLPAPGSSEASSTAADDYVAPRDELESRLVAIWEEVLAVRPIGIRTQFFKLGGYSLMIVRLFARINKVLGTSLPITTIFNAPTVEQLADVVRGRAYYSSLVPVRTTGKQTPFFMIHSYLLYQGIPAVLGEDQPFYGLRELDTDAEDMTVEQRAATYLDAIRSIQPRGPYYIGGWCAAGPLAVETARQIRASGEEVGFLVLFDSWRPGYAAELAREQAGSREMSLQARLGRKYRFHRNRLGSLSTGQRIRYVGAAISSKFTSVRNRIYLKNWAIAEWFCHRFGLSLPHFMHNVSLTTLNSLKEYRGIEPYTGSLTLIRAKDAPYIPGALDHCGWDAIVKGGVKVFWAPGDHESMFLDPNLQEVGQLLRENLANASIQQKQYAETT
jgi:non-ribosomal peptide synthetase component F/thioesterase domain-containing protein/acyl carrier protein